MMFQWFLLAAFDEVSFDKVGLTQTYGTEVYTHAHHRRYHR